MYYLHLLRILVLTSIENLIIFVMREIGYIAYISGCFVCCMSTCMYIICMCMCVYICIWMCRGASVFLYVCMCLYMYYLYRYVCVYESMLARTLVCVSPIKKCLAWVSWYYISYEFISLIFIYLQTYYVYTCLLHFQL